MREMPSCFLKKTGGDGHGRSSHVKTRKEVKRVFDENRLVIYFSLILSPALEKSGEFKSSKALMFFEIKPTDQRNFANERLGIPRYCK